MALLEAAQPGSESGPRGGVRRAAAIREDRRGQPRIGFLEIGLGQARTEARPGQVGTSVAHVLRQVATGRAVPSVSP